MISVYITICSIGVLVLSLFEQLNFFKVLRKSLLINKAFFGISVLVLIMLFMPVGDIERFEAGNEVGWSRIFRILGFGGIFLYSLLYMNTHNVWVRGSITYLFGLYSLVCLFSAFYSPNWLETVWKAFELINFFLIALIFKHEMVKGRLSAPIIINAITYFLLLASLFALIGIILYPEIAMKLTEEKADKVTVFSFWGIIPNINPNTLGQFGAMLAVIGFYYLRFTKYSKASSSILILIGLLNLFYAHSRTSLFGSLIFILLIVIIKRDYKSLGFLSFLAIVFYSLFQSDVYAFLMRGQSVEVFKSLSGRAYMWEIGWESFIKNPLFGLGFYSGHKTLDISTGMEYSSLDNTYLEALVDTGILGTLILIMFVFTSLINQITLLKSHKLLFSKNSSSWIWASLAFLSLMIIRSFTGPSFQVFHINLYFLILLSIAAENTIRFRKRGRIYTFQKNHDFSLS